jgi:CRISPR/Cas system endoribonuclease Cas6 (RAMP superfamily)
MPRVRMPTPGVAAAALPTPRAVRTDAGAGMASIAQGLGQAAGAGERYAAVRKQEQEKALAIRLEELEGEFTRELNAGLHKADGGVLNQQGRNASAASVPFYETVEKRRAKLLEQVDDPKARQILDLRTRKLSDGARARVESHVAQQNVAADETAFKVLKSTVKDRLANDALDPAARAEATEQLVPHLRSFAQRNGLDPEAAAGVEAAWRGEAAEVVMNRLISAGRYAQARNFLADPAVTSVLGDRLGRFESQLVQDEQEADGSARARGFVGTATNGEGRFNRAAAQTELDKVLADQGLDPRIRKAAEAEFTAAASRAEQAWSAKLAAKADDAWTKIINGGYSLRAAKDELAWLRRDDVAGGDIVTALEGRLKARQAAQAGAPPTPAQRSAMVDFLVGLPQNVNRYAADPSAFKREWWGKLSDADAEQAAGYVARQGIAAAKPDANLDPLTVKELIHLGGPKGAKLWGTKGPKSEADRILFDTLYRATLEEQGRQRVASGGTVDQKALIEFARRKLAKGEVAGEEVTQLEAETNPAFAGEAFTAEIPDADAKRYQTRLLGRGLPTGDEWVRWLFNAERGVPDDQNPRPALPDPSAARPVPVEERRDVRTGTLRSGGGAF